jgi:hypothetical protein
MRCVSEGYIDVPGGRVLDRLHVFASSRGSTLAQIAAPTLLIGARYDERRHGHLPATMINSFLDGVDGGTWNGQITQ